MATSGEQEYSTSVAASAADCFATITQFDRYPEWFSGIHAMNILSRDENGLGRDVEFTMSIPLKTIRYVLQYEFEAPHRLTWKSVGGDVDSIDGEYTFQEQGPDETLVTCRQAISFGFWVPGPLRAMLERTALQQSVEEFKTAVEAAARAKPAKKSKAKPKKG